MTTTTTIQDTVGPPPGSNDQAIIEAYHAGEKTADIMRRFGISRSSLYWTLQRNGVEPSRQRRHETAPPTTTAAEPEHWYQDQLIELAQAVDVASAAAEKNAERLETLNKMLATVLANQATILSSQQELRRHLLGDPAPPS